MYRKEHNKWVYYAFGPNDEIDIEYLDIHFPVVEAYEGIDSEEDVSNFQDAWSAYQAIEPRYRNANRKLAE